MEVERLPPVADGEATLTAYQADATPQLLLAVGDEGPSDTKKLSGLEKRFDDLAKKFKAFSDAASAKKEETFPNFKLTGFTQLDTAYYSQSALNKATLGNAQDGTGFRRARLAVAGKVTEFTAYQLEMDFATAGRPSFFDTYIEQSAIPWLGSVRIGQFCQPFSVDSLTGFRNLTFLERDLAFLTFVPFRRVGIMCSDQTEDQMTAWAYSVYRTGGFNNAPLGDDRFATDFGDLGSYSFSGRMTHLLWYDELVPDRYLWHLGGGYNYSHLGQNTSPTSGATGNAGGGPAPFYQARTLPEFGTLGYSEFGGNFGSATNGTPLFVDSGRYQATDFHLFGVESVHQWGALGTQAEYMANMVNTPFGTVFYQGGYAQVAYRLTGENRAYDKRLGTLTRLVPFTDFISIRRGRGGRICGWGAWEVAARWSCVDVRNPTFLDGHYYVPPTAAVNPNTYTGTSKTGNGYLQDTTLGLTWFLNPYTKIQFNWIHAMLSNTTFGFSDADLFVARTQVEF